MKILYVCHRFPFPPQRGGKIRPFNMIRHLHEAGHRVTVASLVRSGLEATEGEGLREYCDRYVTGRVSTARQWTRMLMRLPTAVPSSMAYFYSSELELKIREALVKQSFDLILVHCSSVAQYVAAVGDTPKILDFGDMDSQKWLAYACFKPWPASFGYRLEGHKLEVAERALTKRFDLCTCTTRVELETLNRFSTGTQTDWFPNGVDHDYFRPSTEPYDPDTLCFIGRMDYYPNQQAMLWFCREVLPALQARRSGIRLLIVGADPSSAVQRLARLPGVTVTGSVPDVRPYVRRSAVNVAPLFIARGTQNKILESMAMGVPVVASRPAAGGIDAVPDEHFVIATTAEEYVEAILHLLESPIERARLSHAGRAQVCSRHDWRASMRKLDEIIAGVLQQAEQRMWSGRSVAAQK
ncbi:MAG: TIGR03087 family PEP-CTERM/XrtA system glycosyltransferase [Gammaproteobacteria bacterium]